MSALAQMIKARKIPQTVIAAGLGISRAAVSIRVKSGIKNITTARKYAKILGCNPFFLMD